LEVEVLINQKGLLGTFYIVMEWVTRIAYVNLLWIVFSLLGIIIIGFAPATTAMYTITRKWSMGNSDVPIFPTFWRTYRSEILRANKLFWPLIIVGYILYIDYQYLTSMQGLAFLTMMFVFVNVSILYLILLLYLFPVFVHFKLKTFQYYKQALIAGISSPLSTFLMIVSIILVGLLIERIPGLLPVFPACLLSFATMRLGYTAFLKLEQKSKHITI
jgi:uncharacterized membrane protein YesL